MANTANSPIPAGPAEREMLTANPVRGGPFLHAPEVSGGIFRVIFVAACAPLAVGVVFFGWRAMLVTLLSVGGCVWTESIYYRVTRTPALLGRSHAALTGLLLALTLPAFVPWYVPLTGAVFAILVGKALFGGVGHFLWQPALVGRLAVAVLFTQALAGPPGEPAKWPVLARNHVLLGDVNRIDAKTTFGRWRTAVPAQGADALARPRPLTILRSLSHPAGRPPDSIATALLALPGAWELIIGAYGGGIGETCALAIVIAGLYVVYRHYVRGHLPGLIVLAAAVTAAIAPIRTPDGEGWRWFPITAEGFDVGFVYVASHIASGGLLLAAFFLATEMTSRPVTLPAQAVYGIACGVIAMLMRLYTSFPI
ncbi:MAG TPA: RnfABCDGE type electron transport complex subunit D, partial [Phycisphaerae bacterium]|nr:RnfABCDGE type electron transport complex subunit D [Phycisphaerae bacterium]